MERIRGQERQVFWPIKAGPEFLNARLPKLRVFVFAGIFTTEGAEEHRMELHEELQKTLKHSKQRTSAFLRVLCGKDF
jgi:hypothetical protein